MLRARGFGPRSRFIMAEVTSIEAEIEGAPAMRHAWKSSQRLERAAAPESRKAACVRVEGI